jgi:hypothetical protein
MKTTTLLQLGGVAVLIAAILLGVGNLMYFLSGGQPSTALQHWVGIVGSCFLVFGLVGLFARQVQAQGERDGSPALVLGLVGFVLLVLGNIASVGTEAVRLGVSSEAIADAQVAQVPSYALVNTISLWAYAAGQVLFGASIYLTYRAQEPSKYAGALLILVGLVQLFTGMLAFTQLIYSILSFVAWAWLGWTLLAGMSMVARYQERATAQPHGAQPS